MNKIYYILAIALLYACTFVNTKSLNKRGNLGLHVQGNQLLDGDGNPFVFRGINVAHSWFNTKTKSSLRDIYELGANSARFVISNGKTYSKTPAVEVQNMIRWCEITNLICVFELHDFTGSNDSDDITVSAVNYWIQNKDLFNAHKNNVIINIANEWDSGYKIKSVWADTYIEAIQAMREAGIENVLMIDASGYGQESGPIINNAANILEADPDKNVIFSFHVYAVLGINEKTMLKAFNGLKDTGVCWCVGEFGWYHSGINVPYKALMKYCDENSIGWFAWSWSGNGEGETELDLVSPQTFSKNDLTNWGEDVFLGEYGISQTSNLAYGGVADPSNLEELYDDTDDGSFYCSGCNVTATGSNGEFWGWENEESCKINAPKCGLTVEIIDENENSNSSNNNECTSFSCNVSSFFKKLFG